MCRRPRLGALLLPGLYRPQRGSVGENGGDEVRSWLWSVPTPEGQCLAVSGGRERSAFGAEWEESLGGGE